MVYQLWWHRAIPFINGTELLDFILNYIILLVIGNRMESLKSGFTSKALCHEGLVSESEAKLENSDP